jgi:hypothetical protein
VKYPPYQFQNVEPLRTLGDKVVTTRALEDDGDLHIRPRWPVAFWRGIFGLSEDEAGAAKAAEKAAKKAAKERG